MSSSLSFSIWAVGKKLRVVGRLAFVASAGRQWFVSGLVNFGNAMRSRKLKSKFQKGGGQAC